MGPRAATFTGVNGTVSCFCNKRLQNWPTVYTNLACDQNCSLLIAFPNKHPDLAHQSVCLFSQIGLCLIKYLLQLELQRTCSQTLSYNRKQFSNSLSIVPAQTVAQRAIKMSPIASHSVTAWQLYSCVYKAHLNIWWRCMFFLFTSCRLVY